MIIYVPKLTVSMQKSKHFWTPDLRSYYEGLNQTLREIIDLVGEDDLLTSRDGECFTRDLSLNEVQLIKSEYAALAGFMRE